MMFKIVCVTYELCGVSLLHHDASNKLSDLYDIKIQIPDKDQQTQNKTLKHQTDRKTFFPSRCKNLKLDLRA